MQDHLRRLGWQQIEIIDGDLGRSAAGTATRAGFERMVAQVCQDSNRVLLPRCDHSRDVRFVCTRWPALPMRLVHNQKSGEVSIGCD